MKISVYTDELLVYDIANPELVRNDCKLINITPGEYREYAETARRFHAMQDELKAIYEGRRI